MILCIDVGNTHIFGGVYADDKLQVQFRYSSKAPTTSDQLGIFLKTVLRENNIQPKEIQKAAICSVVPSLHYSIRAAILKYFSLEPFFLEANTHHLKIAYKNPHELGADRISNAIAAVQQFPGKNLIVIDLGTANTFDAITKHKEFLGGVIMPGVFISMKSLYENTAKLSPVDIIKPESVIGQTTDTGIQTGIYYGQLGSIREIIRQITETHFRHEPPFIIGTGGFAHFFEEENIFHAILPELVLEGLNWVAKR